MKFDQRWLRLSLIYLNLALTQLISFRILSVLITFLRPGKNRGGVEKSTFIACIKGSTYKLLRNLCQKDTKTKTYEELNKLLTDHLSS